MITLFSTSSIDESAVQEAREFIAREGYTSDDVRIVKTENGIEVREKVYGAYQKACEENQRKSDIETSPS